METWLYPLAFIAMLAFGFFVVLLRQRLTWGTPWGRRTGMRLPGQIPPNPQRGDTWGGMRMNVPANTLPTDPNAIRIPDIFKTPLPTPIPQAQTHTPSPLQQGDEPYAPIDVDDQPQAPAPSNKDDVKRRLAELESYRAQGILSDKEYKQMRRDAMRGR